MATTNGISEECLKAPWFYGRISRVHVDILLFFCQKGTFLIRLKEQPTIPGATELVLSVRDSNACAQSLIVKHYWLKHEPALGYFLTRKRAFNSVQELVHFYARLVNPLDSLCHHLRYLPAGPKPLQDDVWKLAREELSYVKRLGKGAFGTVYLALWRGVLPVAVKTAYTGSDDFMYEANIMKSLKHKNIIRLFGLCLDRAPYYIITEYCHNNSLDTYLQEQKHSLTDLILLDVCAQVADGMQYLASKRLVHRDLAARNILVCYRTGEGPLFVKIADFGHCRPEGYRLTPELLQNLPVKWTALEVFRDHEFTVRSDVWSFGILVIEIFSEAEPPYGLGLVEPQEIIGIISRGERTSKPERCPEAVYRVCLRCWDVNPMKRPSFKELFDFYSTIQKS